MSRKKRMQLMLELSEVHKERQAEKHSKEAQNKVLQHKVPPYRIGDTKEQSQSHEQTSQKTGKENANINFSKPTLNLEELRPAQTNRYQNERSAQSSPLRKPQAVTLYQPFVHNSDLFSLKNKVQNPQQGTRFIVSGKNEITYTLICVAKNGLYVVLNAETNTAEWRRPNDLIEVGGPIEIPFNTTEAK